MSKKLRTIPVSGGELEVTSFESSAQAPWICTSHPLDRFGEQTVEMLAAASGHNVLAVNGRGLGASSASDEPYDLERVVEDLEAVRSSCEISRFSFWGMSGGGWLGLVYARRYPDRLTALILDSVCGNFAERLADKECLLCPDHVAWQGKLQWEGPPTPSVDPRFRWAEVPGVGGVLLNEDDQALLVAPGAAVPTTRERLPVLYAFQPTPWLSELSLPCLVLCGKADPVLPLAHAQRLHARVAGSQFACIEGAGHVPVTSQTYAPTVAKVVKTFLRSPPR